MFFHSSEFGESSGAASHGTRIGSPEKAEPQAEVSAGGRIRKPSDCGTFFGPVVL